MNKQYIVDQDGIVSVVTDSGEILEKDKYTKNTDEILSLENYAEATENKIHIFERRLNELNNIIRNKNKINRKINIALIILIFLSLVVTATISTKIFLITAISSIPLTLIVGTIEKISIKKTKEKRNKFYEIYIDEKWQLNKIKERIESLSKDKTSVENIKVNTFIEVKPIKNYNMDAEDYFISKYKIDKRVKELAGSKPKTKKLTRKRNSNIMYEI